MIIEESANGFTVRLDLQSKVSHNERILLQKAVRHMAYKLGGKDFKRFCYGMNYTWKRRVVSRFKFWVRRAYQIVTEVGFKSSEGYSREMVYAHLMKAEERLGNRRRGTADIVLKIDRRNKRGVLGYTYANSVTQYVYSWLLRTNYKRVAGNLAHEWCHKMGYGHAYRYNSTRQYTVPYAVGDFVAEIRR